MIAVNVYGTGNIWFARVVRRQKGVAWVKVRPARAPEVQSTRPEYAVMKAIAAYQKANRPRFQCERCGHAWSVRADRIRKRPKRCPKCDRPWKYKRRPEEIKAEEQPHPAATRESEES